ncbi:MAG: DUF3795 domain-containing protein [bacterium]|nr:MAG: DUF3795 domain-containing protein [bacterium]
MSTDTGIDPDRKFAAVCGLYCPGCTLYIGSTEEPGRLAGIAGRFGVTVEEARCYGCRSDVRSFYCQACEIRKCADKRGVEFCAYCADYPCDMLKQFQAERPHRAELFEAGARIREAGWGQWFGEVRKRYTCPQCLAINSAYDLACRKCGHRPGSPFAEKHREQIAAVLERSVRSSKE